MAQASFRFISDAGGGDQFTVISFSGYQAISELYRYQIEVKAAISASVNLDDVLNSEVSFVTGEINSIEEYPVHGVLASFEEFKSDATYRYYRAILVPRLWKLTTYKTNEIFYQGDGGLTIDTIITQVLEKAGITGEEYDISSLYGKLLKREYRCQYHESDFDLISRLMENEGVFYYFEQGESAEKIVFINDQNYQSIPRARLKFDVAAQSKDQGDCVFALSCRKQRLPENVIVRDYNPDEPSLDVSDITSIDSMGQGTEYIYGKNVLSDTEATYLSQIRAEEYMCRKTRFFGESSVTRLQSGHIFVIGGHPNEDYNNVEYLAVEVSHEGTSLDMDLTSGGSSNTRPQYQNSFVAIPAEVQYRPQRKTRKPKITGTLHARIDGELDSEFAQLDSEGRYKVSLPFDFHNEDHPEGLASARVRMMQPYAGVNRGMQFPMAKGTEVLLSFVDGDPDRPIIAGAINTAATPGPVTADNQTESVIKTGGNNKIRMEDKVGSERMMLESPSSNSWIRIGATNDPITITGGSPIGVEQNSTYSDQGAKAHSAADSNVETNPSVSISEIKDPSNSTTDSNTNAYTTVDTSVLGEWQITYADGSDTVIRKVFVFDPNDADSTIEQLGSLSDGLRFQSAGNLWLEARSRYGEYHSGKPSVSTPLPTIATGDPLLIDNMLDKFDKTGNYKPSGLKHHASGEDRPLNVALSEAHIHVSSLDTFNTQEGNIYDFGGYWNYNLGNSFAEEHINQSAVLNNAYTYNWPTNIASGIDEATGTSAGSGAIAGAAAAGPAAIAFGAYCAANIFVPVAVHVWNPGGGIANGFAAVGAGVLASAAGFALSAGAVSGGGAAIGAGLGAIAPEGEQFQDDIGDVLGAPDTGTIKTWAYRVGSSFVGADATTGKPPDAKVQDRDPALQDGPMHTDTTWVTKQFGDSYDFARGNDIDIRVGNSEQHQRGNTYEFLYGGTHEETKYNGAGRKVNWEKGGGGVKQEANWHHVSGLLTSFEYKDNSWFSYEGNFVTIPTIKISTSMSSVRGVIDASVGALDINISASVGIKMDISLSAGLNINMHGKISGEAEVNFVTLEHSFKFVGMKAQKDAAIKAEVQDMIINAGKLKLEQTGALTMSKGTVKMGNNALDVNTSTLTFQ